MAERGQEVIQRYLEDAIAAEKSFETQLRAFAQEGDDAVVRALFEQHAEETLVQYGKLTRRLTELGGSPSMAKSFMAHMFNMAPKVATVGHEAEERTTQNLMMAFAVESSELAMYESLATAAAALGDRETESLAREIQAEERATAEKVWQHIAPAAARSIRELTSQ
jgi:ferritin-like metal-binding protein YciE